MNKQQERRPLPEVKCVDVNCQEGQHCFRPKRKPRNKELVGGPCHACGKELIKWDFVHKKDILNKKATIEFLKKEFVRHTFWCLAPVEEATCKLASQTKNEVMLKVRKRLKDSVGRKQSEIYRDGSQTPMNKENLIFFAQHATATCCRKCIKVWHGIPFENDLTEDNIQYFSELILEYIEQKLCEHAGKEVWQWE